MEPKPLIQTNPYLRDSNKIRQALMMSVASSTAIETGASITSIMRMLEQDKDSKPVTATQGSAQ